MVGYKALYERAYEQGARIHSDSWGSSCAGEYSAGAQASDQFMRDHPDFLQLVAAGNSGPGAGSIGCPATNKNGIAVGASENVPLSFQQAGYGSSAWTYHVPDDSCKYAHDDVCDEPRHCLEYGLVIRQPDSKPSLPASNPCLQRGSTVGWSSRS